MGRILLHEGTHKWAQTKDILYKHPTFGAAAKELDAKFEKTVKGFAFQQELKAEKIPTNTLPSQSQVVELFWRDLTAKKRFALTSDRETRDNVANCTLPIQRGKIRPYSGKEKGLVKMAGAGSMAFDLAPAMSGPIDEDRWIENADSYAWFARRMWKKDPERRVPI